jgi:hypothetical protein
VQRLGAVVDVLERAGGAVAHADAAVVDAGDDAFAFAQLVSAEDDGAVAELAVVEEGVAGAVVEVADVGVALGDHEGGAVGCGALVAVMPVGDDGGSGVLGGG